VIARLQLRKSQNARGRNFPPSFRGSANSKRGQRLVRDVDLRVLSPSTKVGYANLQQEIKQIPGVCYTRLSASSNCGHDIRSFESGHGRSPLARMTNRCLVGADPDPIYLPEYFCANLEIGQTISTDSTKPNNPPTLPTARFPSENARSMDKADYTANNSSRT